MLKATGARRIRSGARASYTAVSTDTRKLSPGCLFVALIGEKFDAHEFLQDAQKGGAGGAIVQAGKKLPDGLPEDFGLFEVSNTQEALGALARFHRARFEIPIGAVGGSNGKTTTKEMVAAILEVRGPALRTEGNLNNEIGVPLTLFNLLPTHKSAVIEMGLNHKGEMTRLANIALPDAAVITVVQPEHLEGLGSLQGVAEAEGELFKALKAGATAVVNVDDPLIVQQAKDVPKKLTFGRAEGADVRLLRHESRGRDGLTAYISVRGAEHAVRLNFIGAHNAQNAAAAFALCTAMGFTADECVRGLENARPYARRLNVLDGPGGITVIDDCYNANPASMAAALDTLDDLAPAGRSFAVLGDMLELGPGELEDHVQLGKLAGKKADVIAFFGPRSEAGAKADVTGVRAHFLEVEKLVAWLQPMLQKGDVVLVKGSRGMKLERVVNALLGKADAGGGH